MNPSLADVHAAIERRGGVKRYAAQDLGINESKLHRILRQQHLHLVDDGGDGLSHDVSPGEIPVFFRDYSHLPSLRVYPLGDVHVGSKAHQRDRWQEWVDYLCSRKDVSMLGTGDFLNAALKDSKSDVYEETMTVGQAKRGLRSQLRLLADEGRIDGLAAGNHEERIHRAIGDCPIEDLCDSLNTSYVKAAALFVYAVGDQTYEIFMRHGTGNGQSLVSMNKGAMVVPLADAHVAGHVHNQAIRADEYFVRVGDRLERRRRYYLNSGSFVGYEGYAQVRGYVPTRIGAPRIYLDGRRHDLHVSL